MKTIKQQLKYDKIKMNWNKNPIKMDLFISFLTVPTEVSTDHLGASNGWTQRQNKEIGLFVCGGIVGGVNWLDHIEYGIKLDNPYNNYVSPFHLFDIMNDEGKKFFIDYYEKEIQQILSDHRLLIESLSQRLKTEKENELILEKEYNDLFR